MQSKSNMQDLCIIATMQDGRIASYNFDFLLDGILYSAFARCYRPELLGTNCKKEELEDFPLPLARHFYKDKDFYYLCSRAFFTEQAQEIEYYHKRDDLLLAEKYLKGGQADMGSGRGVYKNYRNALVVKNAKILKWYARGIKSEIEKLLTYINAIGSKHNIGYGFVEKWEVLECEKIQFDKSMRPVPSETGNCIKTVKAPYHNYLNERRCDYDF